MFKLNKLKTLFFKETFIAFYKENDNFLVQKKVVKNEKVIEEINNSLNEEELIEFINKAFIENTQTYISTIIDSFNQGIVDSCSHTKYKELGINIDNIKILCLDNYSIFIGLYELNNYKKELNKFKTDFIFSPYLIIDLHKKDKNNSLYMLLTNNFIIITIYSKKTPVYSNIHQFKVEDIIQNEDENNDTQFEEESIDNDIDIIDDIDDIDDIESLDDSLDDIDEIDDIDDVDIPNIDQKEVQEEILTTKTEMEIIEFLKSSIKDYYENYNSDFLENIYLLYTDKLDDKFSQNIENEIFMEINTEKIDILSDINNLALKELSV